MKNVSANQRHNRLRDNETLKKLNELLTPSNIQNMYKQEEVAPPSHVWDRIEQTLNQQSKRHAEAEHLINSSFQAILQTRS